MRQRKKLLLFVLLVLAICVLVIPAYASETAEKHWWDAFSWFGDVANFIKSLVVPPPNYWHNRLAKLNGLVNAKFAGLGQLYQVLNDFFFKLGDPAPAQLRFQVPDNFLYPGYKGFSLDLFSITTPYLRFLRSFLTACCFVLTAIICYHKIRTFFIEEG